MSTLNIPNTMWQEEINGYSCKKAWKKANQFKEYSLKLYTKIAIDIENKMGFRENQKACNSNLIQLNDKKTKQQDMQLSKD